MLEKISGLGELNLNPGDCIVEYHDVLQSTQVRARELAAEGAKRAVVIAGKQTAGRGRLARRWDSPEGSGIYFSILLRPALPANVIHMLNIAAALSVAEAVRALLGLELELKWPNDLLILRESKRRKISGILSESAMRGRELDYCITGIGLNLYAPSDIPPELEERAGWLCGEGDKIDLEKLLSRVIGNFFDWIYKMESGGVEPMLLAYRKKCASIGCVVRVETGSETLTGICSGIGNDGELLLETPEGTRHFHVGDITHAGLV